MQKWQNHIVDDFNKLLSAMHTKAPKPLGKSASKRQTSTAVDDASYGDTQIHADKFEDASLKPKYVSLSGFKSHGTNWLT